MLRFNSHADDSIRGLEIHHSYYTSKTLARNITYRVNKNLNYPLSPLYYGEDEKTHEKLYWMYYEEYIKLENIEEELQRRIQNTLYSEQRMCGSRNPSAKKIICLNDKNIFDTVKEASIYYNASRNVISGCLTGKRKSAGKHPVTGEKLHWMYYEDWLKLQENN